MYVHRTSYIDFSDKGFPFVGVKFNIWHRFEIFGHYSEVMMAPSFGLSKFEYYMNWTSISNLNLDSNNTDVQGLSFVYNVKYIHIYHHLSIESLANWRKNNPPPNGKSRNASNVSDR